MAMAPPWLLAQLRDASVVEKAPDLLVHFHYYEDSTRMCHCDVTRRRTNLALFIERAMLQHTRGVFFSITLEGSPLPGLAAFYRSINATIPPRAGLFPPMANLQVERGARSTSPLCARASAIEHAIELETSGARKFSYALFLSGDARGPFSGADGSLDALGAALARSEFAHMPDWVLPYASAFAIDSVSAVGASLSCEVGPHLQSWAVMFKWRVAKVRACGAHTLRRTARAQLRTPSAECSRPSPRPRSRSPCTRTARRAGHPSTRTRPRCWARLG